MGGLLTTLVGWLLRGVVLKFIALAVITSLILVLWPIIKELVGPYVNFAGINAALGGLPSGVWYFLSMFRVDLGLPLVVGAHVARFIVRRIPGVG